MEFFKLSGGPQKLNLCDMRELGKLFMKNRNLSLARIIEHSPNTLKKAIQILGFSNRIAVKKPFLSMRHKEARLEFSREHVHWIALNWKNVTWIDESTFEIGKRSQQVQVWRRSYERYSQDCLAPIFKSARTVMMVWGAFTGFDICPLVIMPLDRCECN